MAALADLSKYNFQRTPRAVLDRVVTEKHSPPPTARDLERLLRDAGYSRRIAAGIVAKGISAVDHAGCKDSATGPGIGSGGEAGGRKFFSIGVQNLFETGVTHANS
jgi:hypothetical protein